MEALGKMMNYLFDIKQLIPDYVYMKLNDHMSEIYNEISQKEEVVDTRCKGIKKRDGHRCRQEGLPNQLGGPIIDGYCKFHKHQKN